MARFHWKTTEVAEALSKALPDAKVLNNGPGGDHDTDELVVVVHGNGVNELEGFWVSGFVLDDQIVSDPSDQEVDLITVDDGTSDGGCSSNDPDMLRAYAEIRIALGALINGTDTFIGGHWKDYF